MYEEQNVAGPVVEIGWIIAGGLDEVDLRATQQAHQQTLDYLREKLPQFTWKFPLLRREELVTGIHVEPAALLDDALTERNIQHWDATIVITAADLVSRYKLDAFGILSRSLEAIIISTRRIDPRREEVTVADDCRANTMSLRIRALVLHAIGRLFGLSHTEKPTDWMHPAETSEDLDQPSRWSDNQIERLQEALHQVADQRLEESATRSRSWPLFFYLSAAWINKRQILHAICKAEPWKFPFRLSRLTATSISGLFILLVTAEVWELGMAQNSILIAVLSLLVIAMTTWYVVLRQRLLLRRQRQRLTEQNVVTNFCTVAIVLTGIASTYLLLLLLALGVGLLLYHPFLLKNWAPSVTDKIRLTHYLTVAGFVAMLGILVGALGASFEGNHYFRHVTFVDEEL